MIELFQIESVLSFGQLAAYIILFGIVFAESGLLVGFFLPGDSLLFTAGFLASKGLLDITILVVGFFLAAVIGDSVGYMFGHKVGKRLFQREDSFLFHKNNLLKAKAFYEKHGKKTIILARFVPVIRTFAPIIAGMGDMHYKTFLIYNIIGGVVWGIGVTLLGYFLGGLVPNIDKYLIPIVGAIVIISILPTVYHIGKDPENRKQIVHHVKKRLRRKKS